MKKRVFSILLCLCMAVTLLPTVAFAATEETLGEFTVSVESGDVSDVASYSSGVLTITGNCTIRNTDPTWPTSDRIVVNSAGNVTLTLNGVSITAPNADTGADALTVTSGAVTLNIAADSTLTGGFGEGFGDYGNGGNGIAGDVTISGTAKLTASGQQSGHGETAGSGISGNVVVSGNVHLEAVGGGGGSGQLGGSGIKGNVVVSGKATVIATGKYGYISQSPAITGTIIAAGHAIMGSDDENNINNTITSGTASNYAYIIVTLPTAADYAADAESGTDYVLDTDNKTLHIKTAKGAAWWSANGNSYLDHAVYLDSDIDVSDFQWTPVGDSNSFNGSFDGQGNSISGLNVEGTEVTADGTTAVKSGMFGYTGNNATIKNIRIINASVTATASKLAGSANNIMALAAVISAESSGSKFINCFTSGNISANAGDSSYGGGLVASSYRSSFTNCYSAASVMCTNATYTNYAGGLIGHLNNSGSLVNIGLTNCYSTGSVQASGGGGSYIGGLSGYCLNNPLLTNCFYLADSASKGIGAYNNLTVTGCGTFDSSGTLTAGTSTQFGTEQTLERYANTLLNALNGWVKAQASADYYTWAADNGTTPANDGYPVFGPAWVAQAQWGVAGVENAAPDTWVGSGSLTDAMTYANTLASGTAYIQLLNNVDITATLEFEEDKTTLLDLNGKAIDGDNIPASSSDCGILIVKGNLTLCDSSTAAVTNQGTITNGHSSGDGTGGGVYIEDSGNFMMSGGNITGNTATTGGGVANEGIFTMTGGSITGNTVTNSSAGPGMGGGVANLGSFNMSGGSITDNTADVGGSGGGVANFGNLSLSGSVNISGNTVGAASDNVALIYGTALSITAPSKLSISAALTNTNPIGMSIQEVTVDEGDDDNFIFTHKGGVFTDGTAVTNSDYISKFVSDSSDYTVVPDGVQLKLAAAQAITKADATNGSFTVKVNGNEVPSAREGQTVTVTPAADSNYEPDTITVTKTGDASTTVTVTSGSFTMPDYPVTVAVSFKAATVPSNPGNSYSPSVYPITEGAESEWTQGTDGSLRFRSTGPFSSFRSVSVDNGAIRQNVDYTTAEGSTYVTLKPEYLSSLTPGVHTMRVTFTGGYSVTTFTIGEKTAWVNPFADVSEDDWFFEDFRYVHENELMQGTGDTTFSPHMDTSRGMIVTILWRMENQPGAAKTMTFTDVPESKYYYAAVEWAAENTIVEGYDALTFGPDNPITREQMAAILYRYAKYKGYDMTAAADLLKFADAGKIGTWATSAMSWANANELITGKGGGILDPQGKAERCQVAAILHRFCENVK